MKFCSLYSGSTGNSLFVQGKETKVLVDSGVSAKKVEEALRKHRSRYKRDKRNISNTWTYRPHKKHRHTSKKI